MEAAGIINLLLPIELFGLILWQSELSWAIQCKEAQRMDNAI